MRTTFAIVSAFLVAVLLWATGVEAGNDSASLRIARLVEQLGSAQFREREDASRDLDAIGAPALGALRKAATCEDMEVRRRSAELVRRIERRVETARLIEPKRVHLTFKDTPLLEAAAEFTLKTGHRVQVEGDKTKLGARRITLDTGSVPFWDAYDQFCQKAELVESEPKVQPDANVTTWNVGGGGAIRKMRVVRTVRYISEMDAAAPTLVLVDGKPRELPTTGVGALRIRVMPPKTPLAGPLKSEGEALLALDVRCDPQLVWQGLISLRIHKAVDEIGQTLVQPFPHLEDDGNGLNAVQEFIIMDGSGSMGENAGGGARMPIRLRLADKPSKTVRELHGTIAARVEGPAEAFMSVDNILGAAGESVKGPDGGFLKVIDAQQEKNGRVKIKLQMRSPDMQPIIGGGGGRAVFRGRGRVVFMADGMIVPHTDRLSLIDSKGEKIPISGIEAVNPGNGPQEFTMVFQARKDQGEPAKLVYTGRRSAIIEVPFTLKDVPLQ